MKYKSTRGNYKLADASQVIKMGMVPEGGLFVPEKIPKLSQKEIMSKKNNNYKEIASWILSYYLTNFKKDKIEEAVELTYNKKKFTAELVTPIVSFDRETHLMELWHGPTAAFKDIALQLMPYLLKESVKISESDRKTVILVATSGDTGKAALEGFKDIKDVKIIVFYPENGVSQAQKDQMLTTGGKNTEVIGVNGNFDDCQNSVKEVFGDKKFNKLLANNGYQLSSANSINWGRLVPQIVYYFTGYFYLLRDKKIAEGEKINITVPTGNFGNILAGYYAYKMGLPVNKFICASNENKVLADFLKTGKYDIKRKFKKTISPSMDILISSNLERFLFEITGHDSDKINKWYSDLKEKGEFEIDSATLDNIQQLFAGYFASDKKVKNTIKETYENYDYLIDPHTGVGLRCLKDYRRGSLDFTTTIIDSTANPYKFGKAVLEALQRNIKENDYYKIIEKINNLTGMKIHRGLVDIDKKEKKHNRKCEIEDVPDEIKEILEI
ncbi:MAG: threonine synthase [Bacillota bacterium]